MERRIIHWKKEWNKKANSNSNHVSGGGSCSLLTVPSTLLTDWERALPPVLGKAYEELQNILQVLEDILRPGWNQDTYELQDYT